MDKILKNNDFEGLKKYITQYTIDRTYRGYTPLTASVKYGNLSFVKYLLEQGADINKACSQEKKRTALMIAAAESKIEIARILLDYRPNLRLKDEYGENAFELARRQSNFDFINVILDKHIGEFGGPDGPYVRLGSRQTETLYFLRPEAAELEVRRYKSSSKLIDEQTIGCYDEKGEQRFAIPLRTTFPPSPATFKGGSPIFAISDIEGQYQALEDLLKAGGVVDGQLHWKFGNGHLVIVGDLFDRGERVTECLWLVFKLEAEARRAGGWVHFIYGNHDEMNLSGDLRYINARYLANARAAGMRYTDLYSKKTLLGQWLRTKNTLLRIGSFLFCHAGLSPEFLKARMSIRAVNQLAREYVDASDSRRSAKPEAELIFGNKGPLWYRGMARGEVSGADLQRILHFYKARRIIIGHSVVEEVKTLYDGIVINIDVPHKKGAESQAGILIRGMDIEIVSSRGERKKIKAAKE